MLQPKKQKFRKQQKGRSRRRLTETRGFTLSYGHFGLQTEVAVAQREPSRFREATPRAPFLLFPEFLFLWLEHGTEPLLRTRTFRLRLFHKNIPFVYPHLDADRTVRIER